jgi:hypothetical protein
MQAVIRYKLKMSHKQKIMPAKPPKLNLLVKIADWLSSKWKKYMKKHVFTGKNSHIFLGLQNRIEQCSEECYIKTDSELLNSV